MTNWQVLQFSGNGSFDHEANTREKALILVLPRSEKGIACSILREGTLLEKAYFAEGILFRKAYFAEGSNINVQPSKFPGHEC